MNAPLRAEKFIYPMPTVEEVVAAGYKPEYHEQVKRERDAFIRRFNEDAAFRAEAIAEKARQKEERRAARARGDIE